MNDVQHPPNAPSCESETARVAAMILHATHLLPAQGPIKVFVHHNTLHAFEDRPFAEGVIAGLEFFGCEPYFSEQRYREEIRRGRIRTEDLEAVLSEDLGDKADELIATFGTVQALRLAMLRFPISQLPNRELEWMLAESDALFVFHDSLPREAVKTIVSRTRAAVHKKLEAASASSGAAESEDDLQNFNLHNHLGWKESTWEAFTLHELWRICRHQIRQVHCDATHATSVNEESRHSELLARATGIDADTMVHEVLVRFSAAFLDQGFAAWEMPNREQGFLNSFIALYTSSLAIHPTWMNGLKNQLLRMRSGKITSLESIVESLHELGVHKDKHQTFLESTLLSLRGWAGMIWQMETNAPWTPHPCPAGSLIDFLAVRLLLDRLAVGFVAKKHLGLDDLSLVRSAALRRCMVLLKDADTWAFAVFQTLQACGFSPDQLEALSAPQWSRLVCEIAAFDELERRRILHLAYERKYRSAALDAVRIHSIRRRDYRAGVTKRVASFQVITCIDDREESFRRHLEEVAPACETFGAAGFFAVVMYYRGAAEAHYRPLCPINIVPRHYITEEPVFSAVDENERRSMRRKLIGRMSQHVHAGSRTLLGGLVTAIFGSLATFPLVARILAPRVTARIRRSFGGFVSPPATELHLQRETPDPGPEPESQGYSLPEMAGIVLRILQDIGMVGDFSPIVLFLGHGSSSLNNPHESAYNCGACSGGRGGPNARAFASMANNVLVRNLVSAGGIQIPDNVHFLGGYHNTCNDRVDYFDLDQLPHSHRKLFREMESSINTARRRNALERARRFESAATDITPDEALHHVEQRAEDLSQARPEYNHATNALCFVGQREWSRGLFLDRRAFLASYDPIIDDRDGRILERILQAAIPVCGGISLEYYFSTVDPEGYGCGSKLPHNITSLAGVMTGAASDLRPGLSAQMVEIHEPLRILFVVQTTPRIMARIIANNPAIERLVTRSWVQLALLDAGRSEIQLYENGQFKSYTAITASLPSVSSSIEWFRGVREHLGFASIQEGNLDISTSTPLKEGQQ